MIHTIYDIAGGIAIAICILVAIRCIEDVIVERKE